MSKLRRRWSHLGASQCHPCAYAKSARTRLYCPATVVATREQAHIMKQRSGIFSSSADQRSRSRRLRPEPAPPPHTCCTNSPGRCEDSSPIEVMSGQSRPCHSPAKTSQSRFILHLTVSRPVLHTWKEDTLVSTVSELAQQCVRIPVTRSGFRAACVTQGLVAIIKVASVCSAKECPPARICIVKVLAVELDPRRAIMRPWCHFFNTSDLALHAQVFEVHSGRLDSASESWSHPKRPTPT